MKIDKNKAKEIYETAPDWFKTQLEEEFGADFFKPKTYENIKTFNDACLACGTTEQEFDQRFQNLGLDADTLNYERIKIIAKAINQGWKADWSDTTQRKYYPYFKVLPSGDGFSLSLCVYGCTHSAVGSRLCFESDEKCNYAAKQFTNIYEQLIIN